VSREPQKILIVEDSPTMCQLYRIVLGRVAEQLVFAHSGVEALDRVAQETGIDLYIVDINMPQMDGLEFLRRLRTDLGVRDAPAIVISTESEESDRISAREAGANAYLQKPWTPDQLLATVRSVFETTDA